MLVTCSSSVVCYIGVIVKRLPLIWLNREDEKKMSETTVIVSQIVVTKGKKAYIGVKINDKTVQIPVSTELKAYFNEQFKMNTVPQQKRFATLMNIVRAAYLQGLEDGAK